MCNINVIHLEVHAQLVELQYDTYQSHSTILYDTHYDVGTMQLNKVCGCTFNF